MSIMQRLQSRLAALESRHREPAPQRSAAHGWDLSRLTDAELLTLRALVRQCDGHADRLPAADAATLSNLKARAHG